MLYFGMDGSVNIYITLWRIKKSKRVQNKWRVGDNKSVYSLFHVFISFNLLDYICRFTWRGWKKEWTSDKKNFVFLFMLLFILAVITRLASVCMWEMLYMKKGMCKYYGYIFFNTCILLVGDKIKDVESWLSRLLKTLQKIKVAWKKENTDSCILIHWLTFVE